MWTRIVYFSRETMVSLRRNVLMTVAGIATVAVSLALFGGILMLSKWVDHGTERIKGGVTLEIFMLVDAPKAQIDAVEASLKADTNVKSYVHFDKQRAFEEFQKIFRRNPDITRDITAADLPESFRVAPKRAELTDTVRAEFTTQPGVDDVTTPGEALKGLIDVTNTVRLIFIVISLVLLGSSLFLIVNTIRLATFARRREIEVMKLVGASNWFVRGPFVLEGMICALFGSIAAVILLFLGKELVLPVVLHSDRTDSEVHALAFFWNAAILVAVGLTLGAAGSGLTLRRFLHV
jgi:cell division transport system permease protein